MLAKSRNTRVARPGCFADDLSTASCCRGAACYRPAMPAHLLRCALMVLMLALCACTPQNLPDRVVPTQEILINFLRSLCSQSFAGQVVTDTPPSSPDPFAGKPLRMHVRECSDDTVRIPFHVGDDRSRTWIISLLDHGPTLRLKHDHSHPDGTTDELTDYGGDSAGIIHTPERLRVDFPADPESQELFRRLDRAVSVDNIWALEVNWKTRRFYYELSRPGRLFRVEFDLSKPLPPPPPPWSEAGNAAAGH